MKQQPLRKLLARNSCIPTSCSARLQRWGLQLSQFNYYFEYSKGENNVNSDYLSRLPLPDTITISEPYELIFVLNAVEESLITCSDVQKETDSDPDLPQLKHCIRYGFPTVVNNPIIKQFRGLIAEMTIMKGCSLYNNWVFIPQSLRNKVLMQLHESHPGISAMKSIARSLIWYPGIDNDIVNLVKSCYHCQTVASKLHRLSGLSQNDRVHVSM